MKNNWGSEAAVRESFAPSAMVDWNGDLYTASVCGFDGSGIRLCLKKNINGRTSLTNLFSPWTYIPYTTVSDCVKTEPNLTGYVGASSQFNKNIHNAFMPTLVQEPEEYSDYLRMFLLIPPTRLMYARYKDGYNSIEGMMSFRFKKSELACNNNNCNFYSHKDNDNLSLWAQCERRFSSHKYPIVNSNYVAFMWAGNYPTSMWLYHFAGNVDEKKFLYYIKTATALVEKEHGKIQPLEEPFLSESVRIANRFIKMDGYIYWISWGLGYWIRVAMPDLDNQYYKAQLAPGIYTESGFGAECSPYDYDFCLLKNKATNTIVLGLLCFGANSNTSWTSLSNTYNWTSTYCSWTTKNVSLVLRSFPLTSGTAYQEFDYANGYKWAPKNYDWPQNMIYTTSIERASGSACNLSDTSKSDVYRLYLNTHRVCTDVTNPDSPYIFYCYCYPGKKKHLYLGYARYYFDSNNRIMLGTQYEFRSSPNQWSDSFGSFTSCSRIISMDCKNGHLWVTWMNADNTEYYAFHILVKDLVGE